VTMCGRGPGDRGLGDRVGQMTVGPDVQTAGRGSSDCGPIVSGPGARGPDDPGPGGRGAWA
jgi:hypothetical protein